MRKQLQRDHNNKVIGGVCSGLGNYFDSDPVLFRAIFLLLLFVGGGGILLYVILWLVLPKINQPYTTNSSPNFEESTFNKKEEKQESGVDSANISMGLMLLSAGILLLVNNLIPTFNFRKFWPVVLIIVGVGLILGHKKTNPSNQTSNNSNDESI